MGDRLFGKYRIWVESILSWIIITFALVGMYGTWKGLVSFFDKKFFESFVQACLSAFGYLILLWLTLLAGKWTLALISAKLREIIERKNEIEYEKMNKRGLRPKKYEHISNVDMIKWINKHKDQLSFYDLKQLAEEWNHSSDVKGVILNRQKFWTRNKDKNRPKDLTRAEILELERPTPLSGKKSQKGVRT